MAPDRASTTGTPRWVKAFGIIALLLIVLFVILMTTGQDGGGHSPRRHFSSGALQASSVPEHTQP